MKNKKLEISLIELRDNGKKFKVTRRIPELLVSETKFFNSLKEAKVQMDEGLR